MSTRGPSPEIRSLFASDISRSIEEVIKVDQAADEVLKEEISEYVITDAIGRQYVEIAEAFLEARNKPRDGIGVWVSGFFGSGKSSFAKMLGLAVEDRSVGGRSAAAQF